jgi:UDP-GlcNAc:undecaprenyl-phosphate GlcNAc-1-phosphate transferase
MMDTYFFTFLGSFLLAVVATPVLIKIAFRFSVTDRPDVRKIHIRPVPRLGGVAIFLPSIFLTVFALFLSDILGAVHLPASQVRIIALLGSASFMFFIGLVDDIRGLRARFKLICQLSAAIVVCVFGIRVSSVAFSDWFVLNFGIFSWPLTIIWIVGITNAVNFIDGLDGLAAGIAAIACGVMVVLSVYFHQSAMAVMMLALLGALIGFLFYNINPAKIFMGDCGSLFLGFTLASASVLFNAKSNTLVALTLPVLVLGIPIFDTLFSMLRRFLNRRSVFSPDRDHFHHRLLALGFKQRHVVIIAYVMTLLTSGLGMFMLLTRNVQSIIVFVCIVLLIVLAFRVVGSVRLLETIRGIQKKYTLTNQIKREIEEFEKVQLFLLQAGNFDQWWQAVCLAAERMNLANLSMRLTNRDGTKRVLTWDGNNKCIGDNLVRMTIPVPDRRLGPPLSLAVEIASRDSLESAGRRGTLFTRLIDEYGIANLPCTSRDLAQSIS